MKTPEKCPKCAAAKHGRSAFVVDYDCGSMLDAVGGPFRSESRQCITRQRDQLAERVKRLEEAGDTLIDAIQSVQCWEGTHVGDCIDQLNKAKGQP